MKIVHLSNLYWPHIGGVETHLQGLNKVLAKQGDKVAVITQQHDSSLQTEEIKDGVQIRRLELGTGKWSYKFKIWQGLWQQRKILQKADVIQVHDVFWWMLPFWIVWRHKIYTTFHGYEGDNPTWKQMMWHRLAAWLSQGNICIGDFHQKVYGVRPDIVSYGAVKTNNLKLITNKKNNLKIVFIGRIAPDTGIMEYLQALKMLQTKQPHLNYKLDVYGDGPLMARAQNFVEQHNLKVNFKGFTENALRFLPNYNLVFSSQYLTILNALSLGLPVIATYDRKVKEIYLKETPFADWIQITSNSPQILEALLNIKPISKSALAWSKSQTWQKLAQEYKQLWHK